MGYRQTRRNFIWSLPLFCLRILFVFAASTALLCAAENRVTLGGHVPKHLNSATKLGRVPADERVRLSLAVRLDAGLLQSTIDEIYSQPPAQRHYLSSAEFAQKFSLAEKRQKLKEFAQASGFDLDPNDYSNSQHVRVSAPARLIEEAFGIELNRYRGADGRVFRGHETEPTIPASLFPHLGAVLGLSNAVIPHPMFHAHRPSHASANAGSAKSGAARPATLTGGSGPGGESLGPADIKTIYGLTDGLTGTGQEVAVLELDGFAQSDISSYTQHYGIVGSSVDYLSADSTPNQCGPNQTDPCNSATLAGTQADEQNNPNTGNNPDNGMVEVALDIEMVTALLPGATKFLIYTCNLQSGDYIECYDQIANDNQAKSVTTSWGSAAEQQSTAYMTSENTTYMQMASQGQTMYSAAGDNGAFDCGGESELCVDDPAAQPYVTGVGGTSLSGTVSPSP